MRPSVNLGEAWTQTASPASKTGASLRHDPETPMKPLIALFARKTVSTLRATPLRKGLVTACVWLLLANPAPQVWADLTNGLIAHYAFEGDAGDSSGHSRHGQIVGAGGFVPGIHGQAIHLEGRDFEGTAGDHVLIPTLDFSSLTALTVGLWVRETGMSHPHGEAYISFGDHYAGALVISHFDTDTYMSASADEDNTAITAPFDPAGIGHWVHYALTYSNGLQTAYRNGVPIGTLNAPMNVSGTKAGIGIHWWNWDAQVSTRFIGDIDEVRIYERALSGAEISALALRPQVGIACSQVRLCWESLLEQSYQVQYRTALAPDTWINLGSPLQGSGSTLCATDDIGGTQRFYRVVAVP